MAQTNAVVELSPFKPVSGPPPIKPVKPISTGLRKGAKPLGK
jgi:hypothetical protein